MFDQPQPQSPATSLDAYRRRKSIADSATIARSRLEGLQPSLPPSFLQDHRLAFLAAAEHHDARALCLLLNNRAVPAGLHHLSALLFRSYAHGDALSRLSFIWAHMHDLSVHQTVHVHTTLFFRATVEAFYRECAKETQGDAAGRFSVIEDAASIAAQFHALGYERHYNAIIETYNANLSRREKHDLHLMQRHHGPTANT